MPYRILILDTEFEMGGKEKKLFDFIRRTDRARYQISICCLKQGGYFKPRIEGLGVRFYDGLLRHKYDALSFRRLRTILKAERTQIIYTFSHPSTVIFSFMARALGLVDRVVVSYHATGREDGGRMVAGYLLPMLRRADMLLAVAEMQKRQLVDVEHLPAGIIQVIHNGVDIDAYHAAEGNERARARDALGLPREGVVLVTVASLKSAKNIDVLLRASAGWLRSGADARLVLVGGGPDRAALESLAEQLGVRDRVLFTGVRDDIPDILRAADALVLPSKWGTETFPNVVLEAMASGLAVITTDVGSVREMVEVNASALVVPPDDEAALKDAIERVAGDAALRSSMGRRGRAIVEARFSLDAMCRRREAVFETLLAPHPAAGARLSGNDQ
ncbi:MAG TPA: glycosyltransferase family 4 protein [Candidatus Krumholzibacteria bacterium]|nr:glycosyltransferase family 4 protein [Candidatus Krumholzibacteria bacterium]